MELIIVCLVILILFILVHYNTKATYKIVKSREKTTHRDVYTVYDYYPLLWAPFIGVYKVCPFRTKLSEDQIIELLNLLMKLGDKTVIFKVNQKSYK
jgi:hypothetical protein